MCYSALKHRAWPFLHPKSYSSYGSKVCSYNHVKVVWMFS